ncbi:hypothetical protein KCU74_g102, partial [Aureobasidium melanogenum]
LDRLGPSSPSSSPLSKVGRDMNRAAAPAPKIRNGGACNTHSGLGLAACSSNRSFSSPDAIISYGMWTTKIFCPSTSVSCCCRACCIVDIPSSPSSPTLSSTRACLVSSLLVGHTSSVSRSLTSIILATTLALHHIFQLLQQSIESPLFIQAR